MEAVQYELRGRQWPGGKEPTSREIKRPEAATRDGIQSSGYRRSRPGWEGTPTSAANHGE